MSFIITRRTFLGATIFIPGIVPRLIAQDARGAGMSAAAQTTTGRVRGLVRYGVNQFYGVPYAASTAGANRFMPPAKAASWTGVRDCFEVGERRSLKSSPWIEESPWARTA
jgi:para-nitrobenzyl esterase